MLVASDVGVDCFFKTYFNNARPAGGNNLTLKLFCNNLELTDELTASAFTEAEGGGYLPKTLTCGEWVINSANDPTDAVYAQQTFTFTGALSTNGTVYGYYVVDADGILQWSELLETPFTPLNNNDYISITPRFQGSNGTVAP